MVNYHSLNTKDFFNLSNLIVISGFILYIFTFIFAPNLYSKRILSQNLNLSENSDNFFALYFQSFIIFTIISLSFFTLKEDNLIYILFLSFIYFLVNLFVLNIKQTKIAIIISPFLVLFLFMSIGRLYLIPSVTLRLLHIGDFNATIVFKHDYCSTLKTYQVEIFNENQTSCSADIDKVLWRVGKESLLYVSDKNITVPTDQIISMSWPMMKRVVDTNTSNLPIISFEFNSTKLTNNGEKELIKQIESLDANTTEITVYGCSSPEGTEKFNKRLSKQRAEKIQTWLNGYFAHETKQIKINIIAEGTSKHCIDKNLIEELANHRKVIIE
jgi:outer membrane protein OmpA-like peptidoglycan-associated protein